MGDLVVADGTWIRFIQRNRIEAGVANYFERVGTGSKPIVGGVPSRPLWCSAERVAGGNVARCSSRMWVRLSMRGSECQLYVFEQSFALE
jgi:hypothetical protein